MDKSLRMLIISIIQYLIFGYIAIKYDIGEIALAAMGIPTLILYNETLKQ